jgi:hypothetical protein
VTFLDGVFKVLSAEELYVLWDNEFSEARRQAIIEPFVSGPEVDVNLIMENGKILFWEISDNEPSKFKFCYEQLLSS